jgi:peptide/nickel transport system permease protein
MADQSTSAVAAVEETGESRSVLVLVGGRALNSSWVIGLAILAITGLGIPLGILRGRSRRNPLAWLLAMPPAVGVCLPVYWLAAVAAWWMLDRYGIPLPGGQTLAMGVNVIAPGASWLVERWPGFLLAGLIAVAGTGWLVRSVSGGIQHAAKADHLWVSRMRGMRESRLFHRHTLRNALRPLVMSVTDLLSFVVGALVLGEGVLGFPGLGGLIFEAGLERDFAVLLPATLLLAIVVFGVRFVGLMMAGWLDPQAAEEGDSRL